MTSTQLKFCKLCKVFHDPCPVTVGVKAVARSADPGTSWAAANSLTVSKLASDQAEVYAMFPPGIGMTDDEMVLHAKVIGCTQTEQGLRTRRDVLTKKLGLLRNSGQTRKTRRNRDAIVWERA